MSPGVGSLLAAALVALALFAYGVTASVSPSDVVVLDVHIDQP